MTPTKSPDDPSEFGRIQQPTPNRDTPRTREEHIDEALDESFPASDPPAIGSGR